MYRQLERVTTNFIPWKYRELNLLVWKNRRELMHRPNSFVIDRVDIAKFIMDSKFNNILTFFLKYKVDGIM